MIFYGNKWELEETQLVNIKIFLKNFIGKK